MSFFFEDEENPTTTNLGLGSFQLKDDNGDGDGDGASINSSIGSEDPLDEDWLSKSLIRLADSDHSRYDDEDPGGNGGQKNSHHHKAPNGDNNSNVFKIITWNIWFSRHEWQPRLETAIHQIIQHKPHVFCLQEVSIDVHNCMLQCSYLREIYEPTEPKSLPHGYDVATWVRKDVRLRVVSCVSIPLKSIFGRRNLCLDLEMDRYCSGSLSGGGGDEHGRECKGVFKVRIANVHLESKSEMSEIRKHQLNSLFSFFHQVPWNTHSTMNSVDKSHGVDASLDEKAEISFLVGDFNLDPSYPENELVEANGIDLWKIIHPNCPGFTEDTRKNEMRFLAYGKHKQVRFDRILLVRQNPHAEEVIIIARPLSIDILGREPFDQEKKIWVSDHFGLVASIDLSGELHMADDKLFANSTSSAVATDEFDGYTTP